MASAMLQSADLPLVRLLAERLLVQLLAPPPAPPSPSEGVWMKGDPSVLDGDLCLDGSKFAKRRFVPTSSEFGMVPGGPGC